MHVQLENQFRIDLEEIDVFIEGLTIWERMTS